MSEQTHKRRADEEAVGHEHKRSKWTSFKDVTVDDLLHERGKKGRHVVVLYHNNTIRHAIRTLAEHNILSAPVFSNIALDDGQTDEYLGTVSVLEILKGVIDDVLHEADKKEEYGATPQQRFKDLVDSGHKFLDRMLITILGADVSMLPRIFAETPAAVAIREGFMAGDASHPAAHRLVLFDTARGRITDIISQSDVIRFLAAHPQVLRERADQTVDELGLVKGNVITVGANQPAAEAFQVMFENKLSAVAVVDFDGNLFCNLSASDLRGLGEKDFPLLDGDIEKFITARKQYARPDTGSILPPVTVHPSTRLRDLLSTFAHTRVHRAYVTGEGHQKPVGVVSLTDVLRVLVAVTPGA